MEGSDLTVGLKKEKENNRGVGVVITLFDYIQINMCSLCFTKIYNNNKKENSKKLSENTHLEMIELRLLPRSS